MRSPLLLALLLTGLPVRAQLALVSPAPEQEARFGARVLGVPDVNGDGGGDVVVSAFQEDGGAPEAGRVYVLSGTSGVLIRTLTSPNLEAGGRFGSSIDRVPDVDLDGQDDLLVGTNLEDGGAEDAGRAYLFSGATGVLLRTLTAPAPGYRGYFGWEVAGAPDLDGDGAGDLMVFGRNSATQYGRVHVFSGTTGALLYTLASSHPSPFDNYGLTLKGVPDVDGDGRGDLLVAAYRETVGVEDAGRVYLYSGATGALLRSFESPAPPTNGFFGIALSGTPDVDGDGRADVVIGAALEYSGNGRAYVFSSATGALVRTLAAPPGAGAYAIFGISVASAPDIDGDGNDDLVVGSPEEGGKAYLFSGATGYHMGTLAPASPQTGGNFGNSVAGLPDVNGDGRGDLVVGASLEDRGAIDSGGAHVFSAVATATAPGPPASALHLALAPNPTRGSTVLTYSLERPGDVRLTVYDVLGREVLALHDGGRPAGPNAVRLETSGWPAGVYVVRAAGGGSSTTARLVVR